jgi:hypothetical protein
LRKGAKATKQSSFVDEARSWIASPSLSSGAHSRDPLARNDEKRLQRCQLQMPPDLQGQT